MPEVPFRIVETADGLEISINAQPRARRSEIAGTRNGALKIKISAPPVGDAANRAIVDFFADLLDVSHSRVRIASGQKSRNKTLAVQGISAERFISALSTDIF
jgi:uncharacterized protein (TIGR00251 family)